MSSVKTKKINNFKVKPLVIAGGSGLKVKGAELFPEPYGNIALIARKMSGKTSVVFNILKKCAMKDTTIVVFASTWEKDKTWLAIRKWCKAHDIPIVGYTGLRTEEGDHLGDLLKEMKTSEKKEDSDDEDEPQEPIHYSDGEEEEKAKKPKYEPLDYLIIMDDLGATMRDKDFATLLKTNRHYKSKVLVSTQYAKDIMPDQRKQIDTWLLFGKIRADILHTIYEDADFPISEEQFMKLYGFATAEQYSFLYADVRRDEYRKNFDTLLETPSEN